MDSVSSSSREGLLLVAVAAWGTAAAITIATLFPADARPGQLPGNMAARNLDSRGPLHGIEVLIIVPLLVTFAARRPARRIAADASPWAVIAISLALFSGLWIALADPFDSVIILLVPPSAAAILAALRKREPRFTSHDIILVPAALAIVVLLAKITAFSFVQIVLIATAIVVAARLIINIRPRPRWLLAYVVYPLFAVALLSVFRPPGPPLINLFEDGHSLMPASEMLHGKRAYRDIVPGHGLISDGLLDFVAMKLGAREVGTLLWFRDSVSALLPAAVYFAALGVTGSADAAILIVLLCASVTITGTPWAKPVTALASIPPIRAIPSLLALGAAAAGVRMRSRRWLIVAAVLAVIAYFTSVDFGVYAVVAVIVAAILARDFRALLALAISAAIPLLVLLVIGALPAFFRVTFVETPPLIDAYAIGYFFFPTQFASQQGFPEILGGLFQSRTLWFVLWFAVLIGTAAAIAIRRGRRADAMIVAGCWTIVAALSFAERTNVYFLPVALIVAATWARRKPWAILALIVLATPTAQLAQLVAAVRQKAPPPATIPYRGALLRADNVPTLAAADAFINHALRSDETFFDFANMPVLYSLFNRRCPIRQYETPFYETETLQREVIARLEADRSVRAALMQFPNEGAVAIDGIPNAVRAPLVHSYLRAHFRPAYERNGVIFWVRYGP